ncbi:MAG: permease prefix domain 1-containing protein [Propionicimonas sp.]
MHPDRTLDIDAQIAQWRSYRDRHQAVLSPDVDELEDHLRAQLADLTAAGLSDDEAFLVAVKRLGGVDARSRAFARDVVENMAPVLTTVFTPLATLMLLTLLVAMAWAGTGIDSGRELLIISDLLLVLVLGLLLYSWSAREATAPPGWFDRLQLVLVGAALLVDLLGLVAMVTRISTWGPSPNKFAALGLNLILLVKMAWSARLMVGFFRGRRPFAALTRWQTGYLPVLAGWAAVIVLVFPLAFGFG